MSELEVAGLALGSAGTVGGIGWWAIQRLASGVLERLDKLDLKLELAAAERATLRTELAVLHERGKKAGADG